MDQYVVNFDYDELLVTDSFFQMDETTQLYIFGVGKDVVKVCNLL